MLICTFSEFVKTFIEGYAVGLMTLPLLGLAWTIIVGIKSK